MCRASEPCRANGAIITTASQASRAITVELQGLSFHAQHVGRALIRAPGYVKEAFMSRESLKVSPEMDKNLWGGISLRPTINVTKWFLKHYGHTCLRIGR